MNLRILGVWILAISACSASDLGGECATDEDCPSGGFCLYEASRDTTFCSSDCTSDLECDPTEFCGGVVTEPNASDRNPERTLCRPIVRECGEQEFCNDLDDDCDGRIDEDCIIQDCQFENVCAPFSCIPLEGEAFPSCQPRASEGRAFFGPCTEGADCPNGICNTGFCAPLCAAASSNPDALCPQAREFEVAPGQSEILPLVCANQVLEGERAPHDACQVPCVNDGDCFFGTRCLWRTVGRSETLHESVCAQPAPDLGPLGASCPNNFVEGDATCGSGLCFGQVCTRFCEGSGDDCSDVGDDFVCQSRELVYSDASGVLRFLVPGVCVARS
ncbi:MAG: hypothetical protein AAGD10_16115 [Myxococcota bacterium]